jgi:hypothetical protein
LRIPRKPPPEVRLDLAATNYAQPARPSVHAASAPTRRQAINLSSAGIEAAAAGIFAAYDGEDSRWTGLQVFAVRSIAWVSPLLRRRRRGGIAGGRTGNRADAGADGRASRPACDRADRRAAAGADQGAACGTLAGIIRVRAAGEGANHQRTDHACAK